MSNNNPKVVCAIVATIALAALGFFLLPSGWRWICWEIVGAALVAIGCIGEWYLITISPKSGGELQHHRREMQFVTAVAAGVTMELIGLAHAIPGTLRLEREVKQATERAANTESNNLVLRSNLVALEAAVAWRNITQEQEAKVISLLKPLVQANLFPNKAVEVCVEATDVEARLYANRIVDVLRECGFDARIPFVSETRFPPGALIPMGIVISANGPQPPPVAFKIAEALATVGIIQPQNTKLNTNAVADGILTIWVWHKPEKQLIIRQN